MRCEVDTFRLSHQQISWHARLRLTPAAPEDVGSTWVSMYAIAWRVVGLRLRIPVLISARQLCLGLIRSRWSSTKAMAETEHYGSNAFAQSQQRCKMIVGFGGRIMVAKLWLVPSKHSWASIHLASAHRVLGELCSMQVLLFTCFTGMRFCMLHFLSAVCTIRQLWRLWHAIVTNVGCQGLPIGSKILEKLSTTAISYLISR